MEHYNGLLCVTQEELIEVGISVVNINNYVRRETIERVRRGCRGCTALYSVSSLPRDIKETLYKQHDMEETDRKSVV